jgi:serine/threonine-protein kinase
MARKEVHYEVGQRLPGTKYVVVRKLGRGGMGVVLEVVKEPGLKGVIKIIHPFLAAEPEFRRRFFDEVRLLAKLEHPNIVKVTDYDELADGTPYFAMELLNGSTVRQVLRATGTIQAIHLYQIMRGLLEGLDYAHTHEPPIVHRDIKAENIFIHAPAFGDPCVKVIDFGVADGENIVEEKGVFVGTPRYAAPEQLRGHPVTPKADIYAAALLLYEGLAGQGPFDDIPLVPSDGGNRQKAFIRAHLLVEPPSIQALAPWVPDAIDELLRSALSKNPDERPESAYAFASKLYMLQFLNNQPLTNNTTVQNLTTMAELSSVANAPESAVAAPPASHSTTPATAPQGPVARNLKDTVVDSDQANEIRAGAWGRARQVAADGAGPVTAFQRVAPGTQPIPQGRPAAFASQAAAATGAPPAGRGGTAPLLPMSATPARLRGPRTFAEAEAEAGAAADIEAANRLAAKVWSAKLQNTPPPGHGSASFTAMTEPGERKKSGRRSSWTYVAIALGIPLANAAIIGIYFLAKRSSPPAAPAPVVAPPVVVAPEIHTLPPDDTAAPSPPMPAADPSAAAPSAKAPHRRSGTRTSGTP